MSAPFPIAATSRRAVLRGLASTALLGAAAPVAAAKPAPATARAAYFVPGYAPERAYFQGRAVSEHPAFTRRLPKGYDGPLTLLTRIDEASGAIGRALMPVIGHQVAVAPGAGPSVFCSLDAGAFVAFDADSLDIAAVHRHGEGFVGGGHAAFLHGGELCAVVERRPSAPYAGRPEDHYGRLVICDADDLRPLEAVSCHGIAPHEVAVTRDGRHAVVANYGSAKWPDGDHGGLPYTVEPSVTVIELASGRLVHKVASTAPDTELRHVAAHGLDRVFATQARLAALADAERTMAGWDAAYEPDVWSAGPELGYLPAPLARIALEGGAPRAVPVITEDARLMRYCQSIVYDPVHDQAIASFPTRHAVVAFDGATGAPRQVVDTEALGLRQPRGLALHPDGRHYAVSGYWQDILLFERESHRPVPERALRTTLFGHSHMTAVAATPG